MPQYEIQGGDKWPETLRAYLTTATWTDEPEESRSFNGRKLATWDSLDRFTAASRKAAQADLNTFLEGVELHHLTDELHSNWPFHLWLTRNGHGAGFWDGDYEDSIGDKLTEIAHAQGPRRIEAWKGRLHYQKG